MDGSRVTVRTPQGELALELPLPGLYNVYNALAAVAAGLRLGVAPERIAAALGEIAGRLRPGRDDRGRRASAVSILLIKNPAGANEVLRTLRLEAGEEPIDLWIAPQRPDRRRPRRLLDLGRRLRAARRAPCAGSSAPGTRAPEMALRLKYAGWPTESIEVVPEIEASLDARRRGSAPVASSPCPPTPRCSSCASCSPTAASPRGVLAMSDRDLARRRVRRLRGRPGALGGAGRRGRGAGPRPRLRHRPRRPAPGRGAGTTSSASTATRSWSRPSAERGDGLPAAGDRSATPATSSSTPMSASSWRRCSCSSCSPAPRSGSTAALRRRPPAARRPGRAGDRRGVPASGWHGPPPLPDVREVDGWVYSSLPLEAAIDGEVIVVRRLRQTVSPSGEPDEERTRSRSARLGRRRARARGRGSRPRAAGAARDPRHRPPRRLHRRPARREA